MSKEIEVKIKLSLSDKVLLTKWLKENAEFTAEENHEEYYLNNPKDSFYFENINGYKDAETYFRVRFLQDNKAQVNLKKFKIDQVAKKSENIAEVEFYSDNAKNTLELIQLLGYTEVTTIKKTRQIFTVGEFEIVLDEVEDLGSFAEFELKMFDEKLDNKVLYAKVFSLIKTIGFKSIKEQKRGYVSMFWNPNHDLTFEKDL